MMLNIRPLTNTELFEMSIPVQGMQAASDTTMWNLIAGVLLTVAIATAVWIIINVNHDPDKKMFDY